MATISDDERAWLRPRHQGVLVTLRADGSAQTSNIGFTMFDDVAHVSVTADRAKTRNLRHDPRAVLHVLGDNFWQYASVSVDAELGPVTSEPGDTAGQELLKLYNAVADTPHPDPQEFFEAMVAEQRLVLRLTPRSVVALGLPT